MTSVAEASLIEEDSFNSTSYFDKLKLNSSSCNMNSSCNKSWVELMEEEEMEEEFSRGPWITLSETGASGSPATEKEGTTSRCWENVGTAEVPAVIDRRPSSPVIEHAPPSPVFIKQETQSDDEWDAALGVECAARVKDEPLEVKVKTEAAEEPVLAMGGDGPSQPCQDEKDYKDGSLTPFPTTSKCKESSVNSCSVSSKPQSCSETHPDEESKDNWLTLCPRDTKRRHDSSGSDECHKKRSEDLESSVDVKGRKNRSPVRYPEGSQKRRNNSWGSDRSRCKDEKKDYKTREQNPAELLFNFDSVRKRRHTRKNSDEGGKNDDAPKKQRRSFPNRDGSTGRSTGSLEKKKPLKPVEYEKDPVVLARRQKQIDYGKNTVGYDNYVQQVPKQSRLKIHPRTPPKYMKYSRRAWDGMVRIWRQQLHLWDSSPENDDDNLSDDLLKDEVKSEDFDLMSGDEDEKEDWSPRPESASTEEPRTESASADEPLDSLDLAM